MAGSMVATLVLVLSVASLALAVQTEELECMFLGYPELEYDGVDRTEVRNDL
jgi:hypothetical protein